MKHILILLFGTIFITKITGQNIDRTDTIKAIEEILKNQLEYGRPTFDNPYQYTNKDMEAILPSIKKILQVHAFNFLPKEKFSIKIKSIFSRSIGSKSDLKYSYVNLLDKCNQEVKYFPNNIIDYYGLFIIENESFITEAYAVPQIIDYQKKFKNIADIEGKTSRKYKDKHGKFVSKYLWKEDLNLKQERQKNIQILIARNMYLFNDSRIHYNWLISNDEYFMEKLVKTFGYTQDKELLKWVLCRTPPCEFFNTNGPLRSNLDEISEIFWTKNCTNNYIIHENTLKLIKEISTSDSNKHILNIAELISELADPRKTVSSFGEIPFRDRAKIIAYLLQFGEQYKYNNYHYNQMFIGKFIYYEDIEKKFKQEFERNNYYNLPNFRKWYQLAEKEKDIFKNDETLIEDPQPEDYLRKAP